MSFKELPESIVIDTSVETSLQDEYMVNSEGYLEVIKKYKNGGASKVFIKAYHPTNVKCADLLLKKNSDLKKIIQAEGIVCENLNVNALMKIDENAIMEISEYLQGVTIIDGDFEPACKEAGKGDFVFLDSPYAPLNPTSFESYS